MLYRAAPSVSKQLKGGSETTYPIDEYKALLKETLSKKRYQHSIHVADECVRLARQFGADPDKAYAAGLLHDIKKDDEKEAQLRLIKTGMGSGLVCVEPIELETPALWHAIAGAVYVYEQLGIRDTQIISAIRYHTAARAGMSDLETVVYLGDLVSADRTYPEVDQMRRLCYTDLRLAMKAALAFAVTDLVQKSAKISITTLEAYNYYL